MLFLREIHWYHHYVALQQKIRIWLDLDRWTPLPEVYPLEYWTCSDPVTDTKVFFSS